MSWLIGTWVKSHIEVSVIISVVVAGGIMATPIIINNVNTESKPEYKTNIELSDTLDFEVDNELYLMSLIKKISNGELILRN